MKTHAKSLSTNQSAKTTCNTGTYYKPYLEIHLSERQ
nr:MAG TPA: hypothetical protein [Caudoviricetes sp.]